MIEVIKSVLTDLRVISKNMSCPMVVFDAIAQLEWEVAHMPTTRSGRRALIMTVKDIVADFATYRGDCDDYIHNAACNLINGLDNYGGQN